VDVLFSGEIGGVVGLKDVSTGDSLCVENAPVILERIRFPEPVMFMAIEPRTRADRDKLYAAKSFLLMILHISFLYLPSGAQRRIKKFAEKLGYKLRFLFR